MMSNLQRLMIFIDSANIVAAAFTKGVNRVKLEALVQIVAEKERHVGCYAYVKEENTRESFYQRLERKGIHVVRVSAGKSVDGRLIADVLVGLLQDDYDIAVLCGGDRDYVQVVELLKRRGKIVWIAAFSHSVNSWLKCLADKYIELDDHLNEIKETDADMTDV